MEQPEWSLLPNRRVHPVLPQYLRDLRYKTMHNRHYIGRQRLHLPNAQVGAELCPRCHIETDIIHALILCPLVNRAWTNLEQAWEILRRSLRDAEESLNPAEIPQDRIILKMHHKLFGVPTPSRTNQTPKLFILTHTFDLLLGNMQKTIIKQLIKEQMHHEPMTIESLVFEWRHHMTDSLNLITAKMRTKNYTSNWIYSKPRTLISPTYYNWKDVLKGFLDTSLSVVTHIESFNLSSDLQTSKLSSDL